MASPRRLPADSPMTFGTFATSYADKIAETLERDELRREAAWSESLAVGSKAFLSRVEAGTKNAPRCAVKPVGESGLWILKEAGPTYGSLDAENTPEMGG